MHIMSEKTEFVNKGLHQALGLMELWQSHDSHDEFVPSKNCNIEPAHMGF